MASRDLTLIMRLRRAKGNQAEIKKLRSEIETLHKDLGRGFAFGENVRKDIAKVAGEVRKTNPEIKKFVKNLNEIERKPVSGLKKLRNKLVEVGEIVGSLTKKSRRAKKELGSMPREGISEIRKLSGVLDPANNAMHEMMKMTMQTQKHTTSLAGSLNNSAKQFYKVAEGAHGVSGSLVIVNRKADETINLFSRLTIKLTSLEKKLLEVQAISGMKRTAPFSEEINGLKVFQKELIKLRMELSKVYREQVKTKQFGVTQEMINEYKKIQVEVNKYKTALAELPALIKKYGAQYKEFERMTNSIKKGAKGLTNLATTAEGGAAHISSSMQKIVDKTHEMREKVISSFKAIGIANVNNAVSIESFEKIHRKALTKTGNSFQKLEVLVKKLEGQMEKSWQQMRNSVLNFIRTSTIGSQKIREDFSLISQAAEKLGNRVLSLEEMYIGLIATNKLLNDTYKHTSEAMKIKNQIMAESIALSKILTGEDLKRVASIKRNTLALFEQGSAMRKILAPIRTLKEGIRTLNAEERALAASTKNLANSEYLLAKRVDVARSKVQAYVDTIIRLHSATKGIDKRTRQGAKAFRLSEKALSLLSVKANIATRNLEVLEKELNRLRRTGADTARALDRVTAVGFANMIISQAAWMAGFQVIFGTLDKFKKALMSVVELQQANVRAMRSARSETMGYTQIFNEFSEAMSRARARTGATFEDLGEILYQLGSAGLTAEEALAALNSTLANIIGTEAEARGITKLIAGLYLNFADQVLKVDGKIRSLSEVMKANNESLIENISLTEKFVYINDMLVIAFNYAQVEMDELRDGLKFMAQSARAANLSLDQMVGILAFLNNRLIKAGTAGRAMRVILSKLTKDAKGFAEAFDIKIDPREPLDFLNIMEQINEQYGESIISVEKLGIIFKKLGLRGAEAFNLIQRNIGEVKDYIELLRRDAEGAAKEMERIRLSDLASQAVIAAVNLEALVRRGVTPLMESIGLTVGMFNKLAEGIKEVDKENKNFLSGAIKWGSVVVTALAMGAAFTKVGKAFNWLVALGFHLSSGLMKIGQEARNSKTAMQRFKGAIQGVSAGFSSYIASISFAKKGNFELNQVTGKYDYVAKKQIGAINGVKAAWISLNAVMKAAVVILGILVAIEIIKFFDGALDRLKKQHAELKAATGSTLGYINTLQLLSKSLENETEITKKNQATVRKLMIETGLLNKEYKSEEDQIKAVREATSELIESQKELAEIQKERELSKELRIVEKTLEQINKWGKENLTTIEKGLELIRRDISDSWMAELYEQTADLISILRGGTREIERNLEKVGDKFAKLSYKVGLYRDEIEALERIREKTNKEGREFTDLLILSTEKELKIAEKRLIEHKKEIEALKQKFVQRSKLTGVTVEQTTAEKDLSNAIKKAREFSEGFYKEINKMHEIKSLIKITREVFEDLGETGKSASYKVAEGFKKLSTESNLLSFNAEIEKLTYLIENLAIDDRKGFSKLWKDVNRLGSEGIKKVKAFSDSIVNLEKRQEELQQDMIGIDFSMVRAQKSHYGALEISISSTLSTLSEFISETEKYGKKIDSANKSVLGAQASLYKLKSEMKLAKRGSEEYLKVREDIKAQNEKISILEGREERARKRAREEVGSGIRSLEEMRDRTEDAIRTEEDLRMALSRADAEKRKAKRGTDEYKVAQENYVVVQKAVEDVEKRASSAAREEYRNKRDLQYEYGNLIYKIQEIQRIKSEEVGNTRREINEQEKLINSYDKTLKGLEDNYKIRQDITKNLGTEKGILKEIYDKELERIKLEKSAGILTAFEARIQKEEAALILEEKFLRLREDVKGALDKEKAANESLKQAIDDRIEKEKENRENALESLKKIENAYDAIVQKAKDGILVNVKTEEARKYIEDNFLDPIFNDPTYVIKWRFEKLSGDDPSKYTSSLGTESANYKGPSPVFKATGGLISARVSAGEGYIPPNQVLGNLNILNSLNGGSTTGAIPRAISTFTGPGGVDNIPTYLPRGSYVLSQKGMAAYERSMQQGAQSFAEGGEVNEEMISEKEIPQVGSFTIRVEKEGVSKVYPIQGEISVLQELKKDLEEQKLVRLH